MHVFQTMGVPPKSGSTILANIGSIQNSSVALVNRVTAKNSNIKENAFPLADR